MMRTSESANHSTSSGLKHALIGFIMVAPSWHAFGRPYLNGLIATLEKAHPSGSVGLALLRRGAALAPSER